MSGVKGRSGGAMKKSAARHLLEGTFQPCRHGSRAAAALSIAQSAHPELDVDRFAKSRDKGAEWVKTAKHLVEEFEAGVPASATTEFCRLVERRIEYDKRAAELEASGAQQFNRFGESKPTAAVRNFADADKRYAAALNAYRNAAAVMMPEAAERKPTASFEKPDFKKMRAMK